MPSPGADLKMLCALAQEGNACSQVGAKGWGQGCPLGTLELKARSSVGMWVPLLWTVATDAPVICAVAKLLRRLHPGSCAGDAITLIAGSWELGKVQESGRSSEDNVLGEEGQQIVVSF